MMKTKLSKLKHKLLKKKKVPITEKSQPIDVINDERFNIVHYDPRFAKVTKNITKTKIDDRFSKMFKDPKFKVLGKVDKYGRPIDIPAVNKEISDFYYLEGGEENDNMNEPIDGYSSNNEDMNIEPKNGKVKESQRKNKKSKSTKQNGSNQKENTNPAYFDENGKFVWNEVSSSEESDNPPEFSNLEPKEDKDLWNSEEEEKPIRTDIKTHRLAMVNCDWDNINAPDVMLSLNSFVPPGGFIKQVAIYPSDFGLQRMEEEKKLGPQGIWKKQNSEILKGDKLRLEKTKDIDRPWLVDQNDITDLDLNQLRRYERDRMKYYYAIIDCDSVRTASKIYEECDDLEFELTGVKIDLRYVPDDLKFPYEPKEVCNELPAKTNIKNFLNRAIQHTDVKLTWEEPKHDRFEVLFQTMNEKQEEELDLSDYIASATDESMDSEDEEENLIKKRELLLGNSNGEENNDNNDNEGDWRADFDKSKRKKKGDIIIKFNPGFDELGNKILEKNNEDKPKNKKKLKNEKIKTKEDDDFFIEDEEQKDEKKYKAELSLLVDSTENKKEFKIDFNDERFNSLYKDTRYGIDPTDKHYKPDTQKFLNEQLKRRKQNNSEKKKQTLMS